MPPKPWPSDPFDRQTAIQAACGGKEAYLTFDQAERVVRERKRKARVSRQNHKQAKSERAALHPYRCRYCHHWHIGGRKK